MSLLFYQLLHVTSVILLTAFAFQALAHPDPSRRKFLMMVTGILSLVVLVAGFGSHIKGGHPWALWVFIKIGSWLGLSLLAGLAYRMKSLRGTLTLVGIGLVAIAIWAVYAKPM